MIKRGNKITALVVAAASIMSVVPAMAAERLGTKDGTIKQGIAFEDGQYGYYGYRTDDDETGIWYNKGGADKDSTIEDLGEYEYSNASKYGEKYAYAINDSHNDDEYLIDLSTGKIVEDETREEKQESARTKLQSSLRKAERYNELLNDGSKFVIGDANFKQVLTGQFGEVWYRYTTDAAIKYSSDIAKANNITTSAAVVLTNKDGKYIDISVDANMRVYSTKKQRAIVIDKYDKDYNDAGLNVRLNKIQVLTQTKDDFYVLAEVTVTDLYRNNAQSVQYFIQKISKARDGQDDGAYLPKSVTSYQLDDATLYDNDDAKDAYEVVIGGMDSADYNSKDNMYAVKGDVLNVTRVKVDGTTSDKVKVFELKLGKVKVDGLGIAAGVDDIDTNLVKNNGDSDHDTVEVDVEAKEDAVYDNEIVPGSRVLSSAVSIDTEGNTWVLDKGKVYGYTGSEWKLVYNVDRNSDSLDVYNEANMLIYEKDGGAYTTVQEGKKQTVSDADVIEPRVTTPATVGWKQEAAGWTFYDVYGQKVASKWVIDNGTWYYIKADGIMATGWLQDPANGTWYYLRGNGAMATGWLSDNGTWYYLTGSGAMKTGWLNDNGTWYYLTGSGAMKTGWLNDNGTWYYLYSSGAMAYNTVIDGYRLSYSGAWI